jgi:MFS family permease
MALVIIALVLHIPSTRVQHRIDYIGAAVLVAAVSSILLVTVWGGTTYPWGSAQIVILAIVGVALSVAFVWWESRVAEPILPLRLFRNRVFTITCSLGLLVGMALFGAIVYLPQYLQVVKNVSATRSGLELIPLMVGLVATSIVSGRLITRLGRYKVFPILGTAVMTLGFWLLSHVQISTSLTTLSLWMLILGIGVGAVMQVIVLAVQNAVDYKDMGTATASNMFFRSLGGAFGTAIFGAILLARLHANLAVLLPGAAERLNLGALQGSPKQINALPPGIRNAVLESFVRSYHVIYLVAVPFAVAAFVLALVLPELPLRGSATPAGRGGAAQDERATPSDGAVPIAEPAV